MSFTSKLLTIPLVAALAVLAVLTSTATAQTLTNPGFELGTQGWSNWGRFTTTSDAYSGNQAARASGTGGFGSSTLTGVTPGATYTLSGYAKTSGSPSFAGIGVHFFNASNNQIGQDFVQASSASYSLVSKDIAIPSNVVRVRVWGWVEGSGSLTVDDIDFGLATPEPPPTTAAPTTTVAPTTTAAPTTVAPTTTAGPTTTVPPSEAGNYYVDLNGDDGNSGLRGQPWRTLSRVNAQNLDAGDTVHLTSGQTFTGTLELESVDSGRGNSPVRVRSTGAAPAIIDAGSASGLVVTGASDIEIDNLRLVGAGRKTGNTADGLFINNSSRVSVSNIEVSGFQHSGVYAYDSDDVSLTYIHAHDNGFAGIHGNSSGSRNKNLYIGYSKAINNPGDPTVTTNHSGNGIVVGNVDNVTIEYSFAEENGWDMPRIGNGPVGIWIWESDGSLLQYNIARRNRTPRGAADGGGFDFDGGVTNSTMQYNISYENDGAGYGLYQFAGASPWFNNTIRYNISENDGSQNPGGFSVWTASSRETMRDAYIYNNVVYNTLGPAISYANNIHTNFNFANNIFVYRNNAIGGTFDASRSDLVGNLWHEVGGGFNIAGYGSLQAFANGTGEEVRNGSLVGLSGWPQFASAGSSQITDPTQIPQYLKYRLNSTSPAINSGLDISALYGQNSPAVDLYGNSSVDGAAIDRGVHEFPGAPDGPTDPGGGPDQPEPPSGDCNPNPTGTNLLFNPGFEQQTSGFFVWGNGGAVTGNAHEGSTSFRTIGANTGAIQTVRNLAPNTTYYLSGWGTTTETAPNDQIMLGVKNYSTTTGSDQLSAQFTTSTYACQYVSFTTGPWNTTAEVFVYQWQGWGTGFADALLLTVATDTGGGGGGDQPTDALDILLLGDSITQADSTSMGYRYYLWRHLIDNGYSFDLIGSTSGPYLGSGERAPVYPNYRGQTFDQDNEGHAGWSTQNIVQGHPSWGFPDGLQQWVGGYTADAVLLHIGTNDIWYHSWPPNATQSANTALAYVDQIIDILQADNPNVTIFLAQIVPYASTYTNGSYDFVTFVDAFNAGIPGVARRQTTANSDVVVVDHFTGFDDSLIRSDGIHPNDAGQQVMAQRWIDAMNAYYQ